MIVYRICQTYPPDHNPIDGQGSYLKGGRWNPKGVRAVYASSSLALARSELARHVNLDIIPDNFRVYEIEIPNENLVFPGPLPTNWKNDVDWRETQKIGLKHLSNSKILGVKVPSVCDEKSLNFILNPYYESYDQVHVVRSYPFTP